MALLPFITDPFDELFDFPFDIFPRQPAPPQVQQEQDKQIQQQPLQQGQFKRWLEERSMIWPRVDVREHDKVIRIDAELPGMKKQDIDIQLEKGKLIVKGEKKEEKQEEKQEGKVRYSRVERSFGRFERAFKVPPGVGQQHIKACYTDGVLRVTIEKPTPPPVEGSKKIAIEDDTPMPDQKK